MPQVTPWIYATVTIAGQVGVGMGTLLTHPTDFVLSAGDLALNVMNRRLTGPSGTVELDGGPFAVFRALLTRPGVVVSLQQLISACWPDPDLEPDNPGQAVRQRVVRARTALRRVGVAAGRLRLKFQAGYAIDGSTTHVFRVVTHEQAAILDAIAAEQPVLRSAV